MRVFIAIELGPSLRQALHEAQRAIKTNSASGCFVNPDNFHITLKFIGEVKPEAIKNLTDVINDAYLVTPPFDIQIHSIGEFRRNDGSTVWAGIEHNTQLTLLHDMIQQSLNKHSVCTDTATTFKPHITLARSVTFNSSFRNIQNTVSLDVIKTHIDKISLMQTTYINGKLVYVCVYSKQLGR